MNELVEQARSKQYDEIVSLCMEHTDDEKHLKNIRIFTANSVLREGVFENKTPKIAASAIYYATALKSNRDITQEQVAGLFDVSIQTVRQEYTKPLEVHRPEFVQIFNNKECPDCGQEKILPKATSKIDFNPPDDVEFSDYLCLNCGEGKSWSEPFLED